MKTKKIYLLAAALSTATFALASCGGGGEEKKEFEFSISLKSGKSAIEVGSYDQIEITTNGVDLEGRTYTYVSSNESRASVSDTGYVTALAKGSVQFVVTEAKSGKESTLDITVNDVSTLANGGFNYSAAAGKDAIQKRTEILGKLEKYAVESHLTGITLFENGGYVKYRDRLEIPAKEYITGYGFGTLSEGDIKAPLDAETVEAYKYYYHSAQTSNPNTINAWNATGSQVSDLSSYITSSFWGTKMNENKDGYEWYPLLAADKVDGKVNDRPIPVYDTENPLGLYKTWRIYLKTGANAGLKYRYSGSISGNFDNREVALEDYAFVYQLLLTGANKQTRGAEMAGDKTYGIKGAQTYYTRTKELKNQADIDNIWKNMTKTVDGAQDPTKFKDQELGIMTGHDEKGDYLQLELLNEIDKFTAMYTLSSSLLSPVPRQFIESLASSGTVMDGVLNYGVNSSSTGKSLVDNTISLGAYKLDTWVDSYIAFGRNDTWVERTTYPNRYKIKGIKITTYDNATQDKLYEYFYSGLLDSCGIPISQISKEVGQPDVRSTKGDSTFKLNINSCDEERWTELFGPEGKINKGSSWEVKPWMSNDNFLNGLYWSINRKQFADNRGVQPSINYFADAYLNDPENGTSYNDSDAHKAAVAKFHTVRTVDGKKVDNYGYDYDKAVAYFKNAVTQLASEDKIKLGTKSKPTEIHIQITWMYQTDPQEYGNEIKSYFETAFNDEAVCGGKVKLVVDQDAVTNWEDVYNERMMKGQFDLAFGAISGNTYNPLNFLEVLKSDNSSGFTLNWGPDTSKVDTKNPLIFDSNKWSFDALWEVSDRGGVVENGVAVKTVKQYNFEGNMPKNLDGKETGDFSEGATLDINLEFVSVENVKIEINKVNCYVVGGGDTLIESTYDESKKILTVKFTAEKAAAIYKEINEIVNKGKNPGDTGYVEDPFTRKNYGIYWTIDLYYSLSIKGGTPTQSGITIVPTKADQK